AVRGGRVLRRAAAAARPFTSARAALAWLEWRRNGFTLPLMVGLVLVPQLFLLSLNLDPLMPAVLLGALVAYTLLLSIAAGFSLGNTHPWSRGDGTLPAFLAARPVRSAELLAVKVRVAALSALLTWAMIALALLAILPFSPLGEVLPRWARGLAEAQGARGVVLVVLVALGLPALTWKWMLNQLWVGLTGRRWVSISMSGAVPAGVTALLVLASWVVTTPEVFEAVWAAVPWAVGLALALKVGLGLLLARILLHRGLVAPRTLARF